MSKFDELKKITAPLKSLTDGTGVITSYVRLVDEVLRQKAKNDPPSQV